MQSVLKNKSALKSALQEVNEHEMCAIFEETSVHYRVLYPPGMEIEGMRIDGAQSSKTGGKVAALKRLLVIMERHRRAQWAFLVFGEN